MYYSLKMKFDNGRIVEHVIFSDNYSVVLKLVSNYLKDSCNLEKSVNDSLLVSFSLNPFSSTEV